MPQETITIKLRVGIFGKDLTTRSITITAYTDPTFPGLAVHRGIEHQSDLWYVTHIESGYRMNPRSFAKRKQAEKYARIAASAADWTQSMQALLDQHTDRKLIDANAYTKALAV